MVKLWRCVICGDPYVGVNPPTNCPFCGAHQEFFKEAKEAVVTFEIPLTEKDRANAEHAIQVEVSNATFYYCAAEKTDDAECKLLFKALGKIEAEHAAIWRKVLRLPKAPAGNDTCHIASAKNLNESHERETRAIAFYEKAARESDHDRLKQIFKALVEIETDHLHLSEIRLS
jgi:rubrerythrin